jgi:hypothetical protein
VEEQIAQRAAKLSTYRDDMVDHFILSLSASSFLMLTVNYWYQEESCSATGKMPLTFLFASMKQIQELEWFNNSALYWMYGYMARQLQLAGAF